MNAINSLLGLNSHILVGKHRNQSELQSSDNSPLRGSSRQFCESEVCDVFSMGAFSRSCLATWQLEARNK